MYFGIFEFSRFSSFSSPWNKWCWILRGEQEEEGTPGGDTRRERYYYSLFLCLSLHDVNLYQFFIFIVLASFLVFSFLCFFNLFSVYIYIFIYKFLQGVFSVFVSISLLLIDVVAQRHFLKPTSFHGNSTFHSLDGLYIGVFSLHSMSLFLAVLGVALSTNIDRCFPTTIESTYNTALNV